MPTIPVIPDETVPSDKGYYHGVHGVLNFLKDGGFDRKEDNADVEPDPDEEGMEDVRSDN